MVLMLVGRTNREFVGGEKSNWDKLIRLKLEMARDRVFDVSYDCGLNDII